MSGRHLPRHAALEELRHSPGICNCVSVRQTARVMTQMYDDLLAPAGLSIGQFSILTSLYYAEAVPMRNLAARLQMDRTSLTRALEPLAREGLLTVRPDEEDRRSRMISLTAKGLKRVILAYPLWKQAQERLGKAVTSTKLKELRNLLDETRRSIS